jgi:hypothetical protein
VASRLLRAGLLTGVTDGLFSSVLNVFFYGSTVTRLWQGVAGTPFGPNAFGGGQLMAVVGLLMHFGVAFFWSAVFLAAYESMPWLRRVVASPFGVQKVAAVYGPLIWTVMSMGVIAYFLGRFPPVSIRWWNQFFGHIIFVALPIVAMIKDSRRA